MKPRLTQRIQFSLAYALVVVLLLSLLQSWLLAPRTVDIPKHPDRERKKAPIPVSIRLFDRGDEVNVRNRAQNSY